MPDSATGLKHGRYPFDELQHLPPVFWQQLASILDLVVVSQSVRLLSDKNPDMADALPPYIARVEGAAARYSARTPPLGQENAGRRAEGARGSPLDTGRSPARQALWPKLPICSIT